MRTIAFKYASESEKILGLPDDYIVEWTYTDLQPQEVLETYSNTLPEDQFKILLAEKNNEDKLKIFHQQKYEKENAAFKEKLEKKIVAKKEYEEFLAWKKVKNK